MGKKFENAYWKLLNVNKLPKDDYGKFKLEEFIGLTLRYLFKPLDDMYEVKVLDYYRENTTSYFIVEYYFFDKRIVSKPIACISLLQRANVGGIIPSTNKWNKENGYWIGIDSNRKEFKFSCNDKEVEKEILYHTWHIDGNGYILNSKLGQMNRFIKKKENDKEYIEF